MPMLNVSDREEKLILQALAAIAPSGGGSAPFALLMRLRGESVQEWTEEDDRMVGIHQTVAMHEMPRHLVVAAVSDANQWDS